MQPDQIISLTMSIEEVQSLLQLLGEVPTKFGFHPLSMKIKEQTESQINIREEEEIKEE